MSKPVTRATRSAAGTKRSSRAGPASSSDKSRARGAKSEDISSHADPILPEGKLYYRIGEVSKITGVKAYVLRYWESEFRWMTPQKSRSKQRLYRRKDIEMILLIRRLLYEERYTIAGARLRLRELGAAKASSESQPKRAVGAAAPTEPAESSGKPAGGAAKPAVCEADHRSRFRQIREELASIRAAL